MKPAFSLCVYCASRDGNDPVFLAAAADVGRWIGLHSGQLVYGGGRTGSMGAVAHAAMTHGAQVIGIIPQALVSRELANTDCHELHVVETMHERKLAMAERADAFLVMPGGIGTLEEFFEIWTWRHLGYHNKPIGLLNTAGYYDSLLGFMHTSVQAGLVMPAQMQLIQCHADAPELLQGLINALGHAPPGLVERPDSPGA
ncbi:MAG: hypothetical protein RLZZ401_1002 [Pseudomonadota bacterium]